MMEVEDGICNGEIETSTPDELFDAFLQTCDLGDTLSIFNRLCRSVEVNPLNHRTLYSSLKERLTSWKCKSLWTKLDKRTEQKVYKNRPCAKQKVLIIGSGPCGLRTAIEAALLGAQVVVVEKRERFSRNNVLHLWPFLIVDLKNLGAKKFFGQFCAGAIDHISIRRLQVILLKVSLLLGVQVYPKCAFINLVEPKGGHGWRMESQPLSHRVSKFEFDVIVGADGRRAALRGFKGKEFRGKLAIGITMNLVNRNTKEEARVEEISGVAFIFNQQFFQGLKDTTGIELENIVYYKDETHYFVMCAKKQSLIKKGVIQQDCQDVHDLLHSENISHEKLLSYAREAAEFSTNYQLPKLDFALNHYDKDDVAMFDFTSLYAAEHASRIYERQGHGLLAMIVGDSLLEPFWPTGSGCARGFLGSFDAAWMLRGWGLGRKPLELIAERESIFRVLPQTTPENLNKNMNDYSIDPDTRYSNLNKNLVRVHNVSHLYDHGDGPIGQKNGPEPMDTSKVENNKIQNGVNPKTLLHWCQQQTRGYKHVRVSDMSKSWRSGLAFCAIIHRYRPDLIDFSSLNPNNILENNQLAFDVAEEHLGIPPQISASEMATKENPDRLMIVSYVSLYYESFKHEIPASKPRDKGQLDISLEHRSKSPLSTLSAITRMSRKTKKDRRRSDEDVHSTSKKSRQAKENIAPSISESSVEMETAAQASSAAVTNAKASNRISALAEQVFGDGQAKKTGKMKAIPSYREDSEHCFFCMRRVYVMERLSAEGHFFHRECFKCEVCYTVLRLGTYSYLAPNSDTEKGHFYCRPHFNKILYGPTNKAEEAAEDTGDHKKHRPKLLKSQSSTPDVGSFKNLEAVIIPSPTAETKEPSFSPIDEKKTKKDKSKPHSKGKEPAKHEKTESPPKRGKHERTGSFGNIAKRLEARPLRRSSIASVRRSDATVKKKGRGYTFDDGLEPSEDEKKLTPLKTPPAEQHRPATPSSARRKELGKTKIDIDLSTSTGNEKEKWTGKTERDRVKAAVKKAAATASGSGDNKSEGKAQKKEKPGWRIGTFERNKRKSRRAMYPPLSAVFNPDFNVLDQAQAATADEKSSGLPIAGAGVNFKVVDIPLNDDDMPPSKVTDTKETRRRYTSSSTSPPVSPTSETGARTRLQSTGSSVAMRAARLTQVIARDNNPSAVDYERRDSKPRKGAVKSKMNFYELQYQDEASVSSEGSPGSNRRNLPRVPAGAEPYVSTKQSTKIPKRRQTGKQKIAGHRVERAIEFSGSPKKRDGPPGEDMGFVLVSRDDIPPSPAQEVFEDMEDGLSESSDDEPAPRGFHLQRSYARRYKKASSDERLKKQEQAKIQMEMRQREQKRLRMAQSIQRELQEVEVKQAELEQEGVVVEKALRSGGLNSSEEGQLMLQWFQLVNKKNALVRYESELVIRANSIQLEDQQGRLEQEVRELLMKEESTEADQAAIQQKTKQLVDLVEQRNALVELLDEDRKREQEEDKLLGAMMDAKGFISAV